MFHWNAHAEIIVHSGKRKHFQNCGSFAVVGNTVLLYSILFFHNNLEYLPTGELS